jgi:hypothetical protein
MASLAAIKRHLFMPYHYRMVFEHTFVEVSSKSRKKHRLIPATSRTTVVLAAFSMRLTIRIFLALMEYYRNSRLVRMLCNY